VIYLLDTNAISDLMRADLRIERWMDALDRQDRIVTCPIVRGEVLFGIRRLPPGRRRSELAAAAQQFLAAFRCELVPPRAADNYASIKLSRQQGGLALDENDLWVAATVLSLGATLVSRHRDFAGIDGLAVVTLVS
jgi:predicted nucleic acid-binding protein